VRGHALSVTVSTLPSVTNRSQRLLEEIETGALDQQTPIGDLLGKLIALGGEAGSAELREWATGELRGYGPDDELPSYRRIAASIHADMKYRTALLTGQPIIPKHIPKEFREDISGEIPLRMSITEVEEYARRSRHGEPLEWLPPRAEEAALAMNEYQQGGKRVARLYWRVDPVALHGVVDQVRTTLTALTAEIRAEMPDSGEISPAVVTNSLQLAVPGKRNKINISAAQGSNKIAATPDDSRPWSRTAGTVIVAVLGLLLAMVGGLFALMQAQGWQF
jgi:hypothetical protein